GRRISGRRSSVTGPTSRAAAVRRQQMAIARQEGQPVSNAWYHYVGPLGVSALFVFAGIWSLCLYWLGGRAPDGKRRVGLLSALCGAIFGLGVGGTLGIPFLLTSPTPRQRQELLDYLLRTPPERI